MHKELLRTAKVVVFSFFAECDKHGEKGSKEHTSTLTVLALGDSDPLDR